MVATLLCSTRRCFVAPPSGKRRNCYRLASSLSSCVPSPLDDMESFFESTKKLLPLVKTNAPTQNAADIVQLKVVSRLVIISEIVLRCTLMRALVVVREIALPNSSTARSTLATLLPVMRTIL